jgi:uncharacterized protein (TIGR03437 family)
VPAAIVLLATLLFGPLLTAGASAPRDAPSYSTDSIVNSADYQTGPLAPNAIGSLYGKGLAYAVRALSGEDITGGILPSVLPGTGLRILIGGIAANIFYVSPNQVNFLVPSNLKPGRTDFQVVLNGLTGPLLPLDLAVVSPALFQLDAQTAIAVRPDGSLITAAAPSHAGDVVILYATGLGDTVPPITYSRLATRAALLKGLADFNVLLDGIPLDPSLILYAGVAPGFAGLYQINLQLPNDVNATPDIQIGMGTALSPAGVKLPVSLIAP